MTLKRISALVLALVYIVVAGVDVRANEEHSVAGIDGLKLIETDHYRVYYKNEKPSMHAEALEAAWDDTAELLPRIPAIFETGNLDAEPVQKAPKDKWAKKTSRFAKKDDVEKTVSDDTFKLTVLFLNRADYRQSAKKLALPSLPVEEHLAFMESLDQSSTYTSADGLTRVYVADAVFMKSKSSYVGVAHTAGTDLMGLVCGMKNRPFWLNSGYGYYMEFKSHKMSVTSYVDYDAYYAENKTTVDVKETLGVGQPWAAILRKMAQKADTVDLFTLLYANTTNLTPAKCGYIYALMSYLVSTENRRTQFLVFLDKFRTEDDQENMEKLLVESYGFDTIEAMEKDFYRYVKSSKFK